MSKKLIKICKIGDSDPSCIASTPINTIVTSLSSLYSANKDPQVQKEVLEPLVIELTDILMQSDENDSMFSLENIKSAFSDAKNKWNSMFSSDAADSLELVFESVIEEVLPSMDVTISEKGLATRFLNELGRKSRVGASAVAEKALEGAKFVGQKTKKGAVALGAIAADKALEGSNFVGQKTKKGATTLKNTAIEQGSRGLSFLGETAKNSLNTLIGKILNVISSDERTGIDAPKPVNTVVDTFSDAKAIFDKLSAPANTAIDTFSDAKARFDKLSASKPDVDTFSAPVDTFSDAKARFDKLSASNFPVVQSLGLENDNRMKPK